MDFALAVFVADEEAHAASIVDPCAPVPFQPTANGLSLTNPLVLLCQ
ncbi:hypothetical protein PQR34_48170 [Paraburkholderia sediminicola]